jgi:RNA polymerase subunit RPABC4/transcription elongation factor Spt4
LNELKNEISTNTIGSNIKYYGDVLGGQPMENKCLYCDNIIPEGRQVCPNCEKDIDSANTKYCPECGQKLEDKK